MSNRKSQIANCKGSLWMVLAVAGLLFFFRLGAMGLLDPEEGRYAEIAREMVELHDWVIPHLNYIRYLEKPPLLYWCVATTYKSLGINEFSGRLWSALPALLGVLAIYLWGCRIIRRRAGFFAALVLATSPEYFALARTLELDMLFSTCLTFALLLAYLGFSEQGHGRKHFIAMWICLAAAALAKSPVAAALALVILGVYWLVRKQAPELNRTEWLIGGALFLCLAAPWFIAVSMHHRHFADFYWLNQHLLRFFTDRSRLTKPIYYYVSTFAWGFFPWTLCLAGLAFDHYRRARERKPLQPYTIFLWCWASVTFVTFSLSHAKLPTYILPMYPACALLVGSGLDEWMRNSIEVARARRLMAAWSGALVVMTIFLLRFRDAPVCLWFASYAPRALLSHTQDHSRLWLPCDTIRPLARRIQQEWRPGDRIAEYKVFGPSLAFYMRQRIILIDGWYELSWAARYDHGRYFLKGRQGLDSLLGQPGRLFFVTQRKGFANDWQGPVVNRLEPLRGNRSYVLYRGARGAYNVSDVSNENGRRPMNG